MEVSVGVFGVGLTGCSSVLFFCKLGENILLYSIKISAKGSFSNAKFGEGKHHFQFPPECKPSGGSSL